MAEFYMRDVHAWRKDTILLSFEEQGYYSALLDLIYLYDGCLPDNDKFICEAMPVNKKVHIRIKNSLIKNGFIDVRNGFVTNSKATQELLKINSKSVQNKVKADKRWAKSRKTNNFDDAIALPRQCEGESEGEINNTNVLLNGSASEYKFEGKIIKLNFEDYTRWKKSYHAIPDFDAQLQAADDWISGEENTKRWFQVISAMLGKKHQNFLSDVNKEKLNGRTKKSWQM